jgi:hypothetical protein
MAVDDFSNSENLDSRAKPFRVIVKALILFISFNLILTSFPDLTGFVFRQFLPKLHKFPTDVVYYDPRARHGFGVENVFDVNVLFNTHLVSYEKKPANQYRIIFIGDSTVRDGTIYPIVNRQGCGGKILHAYDLGYYGTSATKDLMILQKAMQYSPDLIVWSVTSGTLSNEPKDFAMANSGDLVSLIHTYRMSMPADQSYTNGISFLSGADEILLQTRLLINYSVLFPAFGSSRAVIETGFEDVVGNNGETQQVLPGSGVYLFSALTAASKIAGDIPLIMINEPRPRVVVTQADYLQYRQELLSLNGGQPWFFLDLWNLVPDRDFIDKIHRNADGEVVYNKAVLPAILGIACSRK